MNRKGSKPLARRQPRETLDLGVCGPLHRLDLLFHWLESGSEHSSGQLGYVVAIADSGFDALLDQLLLQLHELHRVLHGGKPLNRSGRNSWRSLSPTPDRPSSTPEQPLSRRRRFRSAPRRRLHDRLCGLLASWTFGFDASALLFAIFSTVGLVHAMTGNPAAIPRAGCDTSVALVQNQRPRP